MGQVKTLYKLMALCFALTLVSAVVGFGNRIPSLTIDVIVAFWVFYFLTLLTMLMGMGGFGESRRED
jgi:hypothetical protein